MFNPSYTVNMPSRPLPSSPDFNITTCFRGAEETPAAADGMVEEGDVVVNLPNPRPPPAVTTSTATPNAAPLHPVHTILQDRGAADLRTALTSLQQFYYLRSDAHQLYGLQDWTEAKWADSIAAHPVEAADLLKAVVPQHQQPEAGNHKHAAMLIKAKLGDPLSSAKWRAVCEFQNRALNVAHARDEEARVNYLSSTLLSNMLFDREFPLGVEERVMREKCAARIPRADGLRWGASLACVHAHRTLARHIAHERRRATQVSVCCQPLGPSSHQAP